MNKKFWLAPIKPVNRIIQRMRNLCTVAYTESQAVYDFNTFVTSLYKVLKFLRCLKNIIAKQSSCLPGLMGCEYLRYFTQKPSQKQDIWHYRGLVSGLFRSSFSKWGCLDFVVRLGFSHCDQTGSNPHPQIHFIFLPLPLKLVLDSGYQLVSHVFSFTVWLSVYTFKWPALLRLALQNQT